MLLPWWHLLLVRAAPATALIPIGSCEALAEAAVVAMRVCTLLQLMSAVY